MDLIEGSETSAIIHQTPGNYPKESLLYSVHCESLKSRIQIEVISEALSFFVLLLGLWIKVITVA